MGVVITFFDPGFKGKTFILKGKNLTHFERVYPDYKEKLKCQTECIAFFAGKENENSHVYVLEIKKIEFPPDSVIFEFGHSVKHTLLSRFAAKLLRKLCETHNLCDERGLPPLVCIISDTEGFLAAAKKLEKTEELFELSDHNAVCLLYAPLSKTNKNPFIWDDPDILYILGVSCSKLAVSLLTPASDTKELEKKAKYRKYAIAFFNRGYELEKDNVRFAAALAYRYYSNVHELMRPGERRDGNIEDEIKLAHEWLGRALEMNPQSIKNNYRKGKLIIEKQVPYLLFAKKSFGKGEAGILREIKQVGEEHLAQAIMLYEDLEDEHKKSENLREYAKALFVLGKYYHEDTNLPIHEYYFSLLAGKKPDVKIEKIDMLNFESSRIYLKRCFEAESDMSLDSSLNIKELAPQEKQWTNSPVKKLYQLGSLYSDSAFVLKIQSNEEKSEQYAKKAVKLLNAAKEISDSLKDRKRNTWYISEKLAWTYMHIGKYEVAAKLLKNARTGYIINTLATALLLCGGEAVSEAKLKLSIAVKDKHNLALGLSKVLYNFVMTKTGGKAVTDKDDMSEKNKKYSAILGL